MEQTAKASKSSNFFAFMSFVERNRHYHPTEHYVVEINGNERFFFCEGTILVHKLYKQYVVLCISVFNDRY